MWCLQNAILYIIAYSWFSYWMLSATVHCMLFMCISHMYFFLLFFVILHYHCIYYVFKYGILCISRHVLLEACNKDLLLLLLLSSSLILLLSLSLSLSSHHHHHYYYYHHYWRALFLFSHGDDAYIFIYIYIHAVDTPQMFERCRDRGRFNINMPSYKYENSHKIPSFIKVIPIPIPHFYREGFQPLVPYQCWEMINIAKNIFLRSQDKFHMTMVNSGWLVLLFCRQTVTDLNLSSPRVTFT